MKYIIILNQCDSLNLRGNYCYVIVLFKKVGLQDAVAFNIMQISYIFMHLTVLLEAYSPGRYKSVLRCFYIIPRIMFISLYPFAQSKSIQTQVRV